MKVTIKDIAKMAGVSHPTVSKALNNEPGINSETRNKILMIAKQVNYVPNFAAKRLADQKTNSIGLIWPQNEGLFFYHLCNNIQKEATKIGVSVIMSMANPALALRNFNEHFVDMIIAWLPPDWVPSVEFLKEREHFQGKLLVMGGGQISDAHRITIDRKSGLHSSVKYLAQLGHRKIVYIGAQNDKMVGFMQGLLELNLEYHPDYLLVVDDKFEVSEEKLISLLTGDKKPTALIADSQGTLFMLVKILRRHQIRIPDDFSLIVYDDIPEMEIFDIPLTSVGPSIKSLVSEALNIFLDKNPQTASNPWVNIEVIPELTIRQSTRTLSSSS